MKPFESAFYPVSAGAITPPIPGVITPPRDNTALDWTFISPPALLAEGERTGSYRVGGEILLMEEDKPAGISVADFAVAIVDEIENPKHKRGGSRSRARLECQGEVRKTHAARCRRSNRRSDGVKVK